MVLGSVGVVSKVPVSRIVGVDEGVHVHGLHVVVVVLLLLWCVVVSLLLLLDGLAIVRVVCGGVLAVGPGGDVGALEDPEAVLAGAVPHGDGLPVLVDVAVLPDPLPVSRGLLPEHGAVLLGEGGPKPAIAGIEPLLLQDLGILGIQSLATHAGCETRSNKLEKITMKSNI